MDKSIFGCPKPQIFSNFLRNNLEVEEKGIHLYSLISELILSKPTPVYMPIYSTIEKTYSFKRVTFYSIRLENETYTEIEKFIIRFLDDEKYVDELQNLLALLKIMGNEKGAIPILFRDESEAQALPPERYHSIKQNLSHFVDTNLRLFCLRISSEIVILFNGGIKESQKTQDSPDLIAKFRFAQRACRAINEKIKDKDLKINNLQLIGDFELII